MSKLFHWAIIVVALGITLFGANSTSAAYRAFNVTDFGALCNGDVVHGNDTAAIQAAINAAEAIAGNGNGKSYSVGQAGRVEFPAGQTCVYSTLRINQSVVLESSGSKQAFLRQAQSGSQNGTEIYTGPQASPTGTAYASITIAPQVLNSHGDPQPPAAPAEVQVRSNWMVE